MVAIVDRLVDRHTASRSSGSLSLYPPYQQLLVDEQVGRTEKEVDISCMNCASCCSSSSIYDIATPSCSALVFFIVAATILAAVVLTR